MSFLTRSLAACCCLAIASPAVLLGAPQLSPQTPEQAIVGALGGDQVYPSAAIGASGGFLVWQDNAVTDRGLRIRSQRLDSSLSPVGQPEVVSSAWKSKTAGDQEKPQVTLLSDGGALVVWQAPLLKKKQLRRQIFARRLTAEGSPVGKDVRLSSNIKADYYTPVVTTLSGTGNIVIVWASEGEDGDRLGLFGQVFSPEGKAVGSQFRVNQFTPNNQRSPAIAALSDGRFVVAWVSEMQRFRATAEIYARVFDATGAAVVGEFLVTASATNAAANPCVVGLSNGGFAVAWSRQDDTVQVSGGPIAEARAGLSQNSWDIFGRIFGGNLAAAGAPFRLNSTTYGDQFAPQLAATSAGAVAVWTSLKQDGSWEGVYGQAFANNGDFAGGEFLVNTTTIGPQQHPAIAGNAEGRVLAIWTSFEAGTSFDLFSKTYLQSSGQ